jgi:hypothetical protein
MEIDKIPQVTFGSVAKMLILMIGCLTPRGIYFIQ